MYHTNKPYHRINKGNYTLAMTARKQHLNYTQGTNTDCES